MEIWSSPEFAVLKDLLKDETVWLVGGGPRDWLLGRPVVDLDLVLRGAERAAQRVRQLLAGAWVVLDEGVVYRVAVPRSSLGRAITLDFCELQGDGIGADLAARDFTVNAIAHSLFAFPPADDSQWVDPFQGRRDLARRRLRAISQQNLHHDPLRCLRAFRFAALLGLQLSTQTRAWLRTAAPGLASVPGERLWQECRLILGPAGTAPWWRRMARAGVANEALPGLDWGAQPDRADVLAGFEEIWETPESGAPGGEPPTADARLAALAWDADPTILQRLADRLRLSRRERATVVGVGPCARALLEWACGQASWQPLWEVYRRHPAVADTALVLGHALARLQGLPVPARRLRQAAEHFQGSFRDALRSPLLTGHDLLALSERASGPWVGDLLHQLAAAQALQEVGTREDALAWALQRLAPPQGQPPSRG